MKTKIGIIGIVLVFMSVLASCQKRLELSDDRIFDSAGLLKKDEQDKILVLIQALEKKIGSQLAIVIIDTLNGKKLETYSLKTFQELELGRDKYKDGVLVTVVNKEHKIRIEVGYGLERIIKDEIAAQIIREIMVPKFRDQKYYEGIYAAVDETELPSAKSRRV
ncbi:MAG: TPM domain-containing protein [Cyclobacteriaceae bacterium]|nr:TPM domain-containing protein [Cyclobacteriaceae bacterium]